LKQKKTHKLQVYEHYHRRKKSIKYLAKQDYIFFKNKILNVLKLSCCNKRYLVQHASKQHQQCNWEIDKQKQKKATGGRKT